MKIVIITFMFPPLGIGGTEIVSLNLSHKLSEQSHSVCVITSSTEITKYHIDDVFSVTGINYPKIKFLGIIIFWIKCFFIIKKQKPDIIHCQGIQVGISALFAKFFLKIPYVVWCQGSDVYLNWRFKKIVSGLTFSMADKVIVLTRHMGQELKKITNKTTIVLGNGVNTEKFSHNHQKNPNKLILFVGSLKSVKGVKYLIEAFHLLNKDIKNVKLTILGDGDQKKYLEQKSGELLDQNIFFFGRASSEDIIKYMSMADLLVLPSLSEGFPIVILEAFAAGLPVISTNVRGLPEIVEDGKNGFLVEPKNPQQLSKKILVLLKDENLRKKMSINNLKKVEGYSWDSVVSKLIEIYYSCLKD